MTERGGSTTQSGIIYQNSVAALYLGRLCDTTSRVDSERVVKVRVEAPTDVDDIVVTFADGGSKYIQAKENIRDTEQAWATLWNDFEAQFHKPNFKRGKDQLLLHTGEPHNEHHALRELCERAAHSSDPVEWSARLATAQKDLLKKIKSILSASLASDAGLLLTFFSHIEVEIASLTQVERDMAPRWMPLSNELPFKLFRLLRDRVGGKARRRGEFTEEELRTKLEVEDQISFNTQPDIAELLARVKECGAVLQQHKHTFGNTGEHLKRAVVEDIVRWAQEASGEDSLALLLDQAGMGKTIVARDVLLELDDSGVTVLAIKADQQFSGIDEPEDLRIRLRLPDSVERVVERLAERGRVVVLIDQIDALSLSMARDQQALNLVLDLVARLRRIPHVCILMSCRIFDLNNDPRLKQLGVTRRFSITELSEEEVKDVLQKTGLNFDRLSPATQQLLKIPLHLDLFVLAMESQVAPATGLSEAQGILSLQDLYTLLWRNVVRKAVDGAPPISQREQVISILTNYMNTEQRTSAPQSIIGKADDPLLETAASWLASEGILIPGGTEWSFLHQTFFDYCYAKEFVEGGGSLSETVLKGDQGIFARPQIIQVLTYLRGINPQIYLREMNRLLTVEGLRSHLYDLVIRWFGALPAPTDDEWLIARRMILNSNRQRRLVAAMGGNPGWFEYLKGSAIQTLLEQEDELLDSLVIPYLISMLDRAQAEVINLVRLYLGRSDQWNRRLRWMLSSIRDWKTPEAIDLFEQMLNSLSPADIEHAYQLDEVATADPRTGCRLVRMAFDKVLDNYLVGRKEEGAYLFSLSTYLEQFNGSTMHEALKVITQKEPEYFLETMLPWLERVIALRTEPEDMFPFYASDEFSILGWYSDSFVVKHQLIEAFITALTSLATNDAEKFRSHAERLSASSRATPQRLLAHVYRALPEPYANDALRFLVADQRRLNLGDHEQYDTRQLISAIYPHLTAEQRAELEGSILSFNYIRKYDGVGGLRWRGLEQLYLLQAIPKEMLTERGARALRELERKFPNQCASESPSTARGGAVGPPIAEEQARKMSDRAWLRAMAKYYGDVRHKYDFLKGGAYELGGLLVRLTKEEPERFYSLALRVPDDVDDAYVNAFLNGIAESEAPAEWLFAVVRRFASHPGRDIKRVIAHVLEKRVKDGLPDDMVNLIEGYVRGPSGKDEDWWKRREENNQARHHDGLNSGPYSSYLNSDRGASLRALMRALDEKGSGEAKEQKWELIDFVATDPSTALRAGAIEELLYLLADDRERAVTTFERLIEGHPALLRSHFTQEFLRYGIYRYYSRVRPFIVTLMNESHEPLQQRGAELACIAAISPKAIGSEVEHADALALANGTITGPPSWRRGAARVYAANVTTESSTECIDRLRQLLSDDDKEVRQFVNGVFHRLKDEHFFKLRDLTEAFAASRSLSSETHSFTEFLWEHGLLDPSFSLSVVESILHKEDESVAEDPAHRFYSGGEELVRLVLRIYTYPGADDEMRKRAMDIFDQLMDVYAGHAQMVLGEWDRR